MIGENDATMPRGSRRPKSLDDAAQPLEQRNAKAQQRIQVFRLIPLLRKRSNRARRGDCARASSWRRSLNTRLLGNQWYLGLMVIVGNLNPDLT
jgi:hypothetical protein